MPEAIGRFHWLVIDTVDPARIAPFWCALLGVEERGWFADDYLDAHDRRWHAAGRVPARAGGQGHQEPAARRSRGRRSGRGVRSDPRARGFGRVGGPRAPGATGGGSWPTPRATSSASCRATRTDRLTRRREAPDGSERGPAGAARASRSSSRSGSAPRSPPPRSRPKPPPPTWPPRPGRSSSASRAARRTGAATRRSPASIPGSLVALRPMKNDADDQDRERRHRGLEVLLPRHDRARDREQPRVEEEARGRTTPARGRSSRPRPMGSRASRRAFEVNSATSPISSSCASPSRPMPRILPRSSCDGRTVASSTSTTREDFSSTTPAATQ